MSRPQRLRLLGLLLALLVAMGACSDGGGSDAKSSSGGDGAAATKPVDEPDDLVEITSRGSEPRHKMRLRVEKGQKQQFTTTAAISYDLTFDGQPLPSTKVPTTRITAETTVDDVLADGTIRYSFVYTKVEALPDGADPDVVAKMQPLLDQMAGVTGTAELTARGEAIKATVDSSKVSDASVKAQLDQFVDQIGNLTVPFPDQAVGKGAQWSATNEVTLNGITTQVRNVYRLSSVAEDRYELTITQRQTAKQGPVALAGLPEGAKADLQSMDIEGKGTTLGFFAKLLPTATISSTGEIKMHVTAGGDEGDVRQQLSLKIDLQG